MSHISRIKTQMVEREHLVQALTDLGYACQVGDLGIRSLGAERRNVEVRIKLGGVFGRQVGFAKAGSTYEMVADWWGAGSAERTQFLQQVTQRYAYHAARAKLQAQGFDLVNEETSQDGQIRLVLRRVSGQ
jgi:hypothetical protein